MTPEAIYAQKVGIGHRKKYAQFFTPPEIAETMIAWLLQNESLHSVLEPAFGLGVFSRLLLQHIPGVQIKGFDVDPIITEEAMRQFSDVENVKITSADYIFSDWKRKYDGILCNPPYFKFHDYDNKKALEEVKEKMGIQLNGFTNVYALFLLKAIHQLAFEGRAAFIIPSEFLNAGYGTYVKQYLIASNTLKYVIVFDFEEKVFADALTTSAILLLSQTEEPEDVKFITIKNKEEFKQLRAQIQDNTGDLLVTRISHDKIDPKIKWRAYYQQRQSDKYHNLVPFKNVAKVVRGIATGANSYFVFNREKADTYAIPENNLLPCITKSKDVLSPFFTKDHFNELLHENRNIYLFHAERNPADQNVIEYIEKGEDNGIHKKYLTSKRNPWYSHENRPPSPIWVGVFNRDGIKFVRNEANISNLTTFHCVYIKDDLFENIDPDLLFSYLLTDIAKEIFSDNRREYGGGLRKFEPNDLNNALMLDLSVLTTEEKEAIKERYAAFRESVLKGEENSDLIKQIEVILKTRFAADPPIGASNPDFVQEQR